MRLKKEVNGIDKSLFGAFERGVRIDFSLSLPRSLGVTEVLFKSEGKALPFSFTSSEGGKDLYRFSLEADKKGLFFYSVELRSGDERLYSSSTNNLDFDLKKEEGAPFTLVFHLPLSVPEFLHEGVVYQIFPDRFRRGAGEVDVHGKIVSFDEGIPEYAERAGDPVENDTFFGGNLWGVVEKLCYLEALSVKTIYLNPIFSSPSNHRYDTSDYEKIDSLLGGKKAFDALIKEAHKKGMKIILDGVFNHTGSDSRYFNKKGRFDSIGAYQSQSSPFYPWYSFYDFPDKYEAWWGIDILPRLDHSNQTCLAYFAENIAKKWLCEGADGWRLDVADELSGEFLERLHDSVKALGDKAIIGEVWENAVTKESYGERREYLQGRQLDSVMNYPFREAVIRLLTEGDTDFFYNTLTELYSSYPKASSDALWNILSTHDTERILTRLVGESGEGKERRELQRLRLSKEEYEKGRELLKLASLIQYTVFGTPLLYYGDEAGLEGYGDPFCRLPYPWGKEDGELLSHYRELGELRRAHPALRDGTFEFTLHTKDTIEYERRKGGDRVRVKIKITKS